MNNSNAIYRLLNDIVREPACAVLARTNRRAGDEGWPVAVPGFVKPWAGRVISVRNDSDAFLFVNAPVVEPRLQGRVFRTVPMPPITEDDEQNVATILFRFVTEHPQLKSALETACPAYPFELLQYRLCAGAETFELDPMNQMRLGGEPAWVQDEEFPTCEECNQVMSLILQTPGTLLPGRAVPRGTFYFFGCAVHPERTRTIGQFT